MRIMGQLVEERVEVSNLEAELCGKEHFPRSLHFQKCTFIKNVP